MVVHFLKNEFVKLEFVIPYIWFSFQIKLVGRWATRMGADGRKWATGRRMRDNRRRKLPRSFSAMGPKHLRMGTSSAL
jgi:hypothetical protein